MEKSVPGMESVTVINANVMMVGKDQFVAAAEAKKTVLVRTVLDQCYLCNYSCDNK